jgi:2-oxoglutarate ferredoxin oxidoreductase subunit beta
MTGGNGHNGTGTDGGAPLGLSKKDFASDQETRWCPGCGDYAILATVQQFIRSILILELETGIWQKWSRG